MREWQRRADELAREAYAAGQPLAWFDRLYGEGVAGASSMPWDHDTPHPLLADWSAREHLVGQGSRAVVVGCGLGVDAEHVGALGFATTAFDLSPVAIAQARDRHPGSLVDYRVADLLALPSPWRHAFDLVVEIFTLQAVPDPPREAMARAVRDLVAPGGSLLLVAFRADDRASPDEGPPFPLTEEFVAAMATDGLVVTTSERLDGPFWRVVYRRG